MNERNPKSIVCDTPQGKKELTLKSTIILSSLEVLLSGIPFPKEEDFFKLADKLQESPPPGLSPEALSLVDHILRGKPPI